MNPRQSNAIRTAARWCLPAAAVGLAIAARPSRAAAQVPNLVDVSAQYVPTTRDDDPKSTESQISSYQVNLNVPIRLSPRRFMILGGGYRAETYTYSQMDKPRAERTFHAPELSALFVQVLGGGWVATGRVSASLAGGFEHVDRGLLKINAIALASKTLSRELTIGGGALLTTGFGTTLPLPALLVNWRPTEAVLVETLLPAFINARYTAWDRVEIGGRVELTGSTYALRDRDVTDRWPCAGQTTDDPTTPDNEMMARPDQCIDHVSYTVANLGLLGGVRLTSSIWLTAFTGVTLYRHAERQNRDGDAVEGGAQSLPRTVFVRTNLTWRIPRS